MECKEGDSEIRQQGCCVTPKEGGTKYGLLRKRKFKVGFIGEKILWEDKGMAIGGSHLFFLQTMIII